ncbi:MAG: DUF4349 domain-containing protein [Actinomycetia bacterium]|nr:DUF4349 domain-containing protein [Actinomycetes bacterium]MCP4959768.1 DUF4349 domain-containing protein [Actinomycetes bacterium]
MKTRTVWRAVALILALLMMSAACGDSNDSSSDQASATTVAYDTNDSDEPAEVIEADGDDGGSDQMADMDAEAESPAAESDESLGSGAGSQSSLAPADLGRDIVFTAFITVEVDDVATASKAAVDAVAPLGGLVFGQDTTVDPYARTVLIIKVQPKAFDEALARLGEIGELREQNVSAEDVTERVVDLESRIVTAEASAERLRLFLENATTLEQVAAMERELQQRETDLELLRGQLRTIERAVSLATITVTIDERRPDQPNPELSIEVTAYVGHDSGRGCDSAGLPELNEGEDVTVCYRIENVGDTDLTDVEVADPRRSRRDRIVSSGAVPDLFQPGDVRIYYVEVEAAEPDLVSRPRVSAAIVDSDDGAPESVSATTDVAMYVEPDESLPGVGTVAKQTLSTTVFVLYLVFLALIALSPLLLIAGVVFWLVRRRRRTAQAAAPLPQPAESPVAEE